jgi:hypothetical protein
MGLLWIDRGWGRAMRCCIILLMGCTSNFKGVWGRCFLIDRVWFGWLIWLMWFGGIEWSVRWAFYLHWFDAFDWSVSPGSMYEKGTLDFSRVFHLYIYAFQILRTQRGLLMCNLCRFFLNYPPSYGSVEIQKPIMAK